MSEKKIVEMSKTSFFNRCFQHLGFRPMVEGSKALFDRLFVFLFGFLLFFFVDAILGDRFFFLSREKWPWKDGDYVTPTKYCYFL